MRISKHSILVTLSLTFLLAFSLVTGCVSSQDTKSAEAGASDVRVPPGDPTAFWDALGWDEMSKAEQDQWGVLGWDADSWAGDARPPASEDKYWNQLNDKEKAACEKLGYTKPLWDGS